MKLIYCFIFLCTFSLSSQSAEKKYFNLIASYNELSNISNEPETTPVKYPSHQEIDLNIFLRPGWQLQLIYANSIKSNYNFSGAGLRIQTPGVFLFGSETSQLSSKRHRAPIDTSVHAELLRIFDQTNPLLKSNYYLTRAGLTLDWVPLKNGYFFFSFDVSVFLIRSDLNLKTSLGLGIEI